MRISQENENQERPASDQPPSQSWAQKTVRLTFPRSCRIRSRGHYQKLRKQGKRAYGKCLSLDYLVDGLRPARLGITVSKRYGKANERNRFKRLVREAFRLQGSHLPPGLELNVRPCETDTLLTLNQVIQDLSLAQSATEKGR